MSVAQGLSTGLSRGGPGFDITAGPLLDVCNWEVSAAFVCEWLDFLFFMFFMIF